MDYRDKADFNPPVHEGSLSPIRAWVQKVLPQAYDDSLSYYEMLSRVLKTINEVIENMDELADEYNQTVSIFNQLQDYVNNFFEDLDYEQALVDQLNELLTSGQFNALFRDAVNEASTDWFNEHLSGSEWVLDDSLTNDAAAAPAGTVGDRLKEVFDLRGTRSVTIPNGSNLNDYMTIGNYIVSPAEASQTMLNIPIQYPGRLIVMMGTISSRRTQFYITNTKVIRIYARFYDTTSWSEWQDLVGLEKFDMNGLRATAIGRGSDLNSYTEVGNYRVTTAEIAATIANIPTTIRTGRLSVISGNQSNWRTQIYVTNTSNLPRVYYRDGNLVDGVYEWTDWFVVNTRTLARNKLRILGIGNSYTKNALRYVWKILNDAGFDVIVGQWYYPGSTLNQQYVALNAETKVDGKWTPGSGQTKHNYRKYTGTNPTYEMMCFHDVLEAEDWNVVVFQQQSMRSGRYGTYVSSSDGFKIDVFRDQVASIMNKSVQDIDWGIMLPWSYADEYVPDTEQGVLDYETYYQSSPAIMLDAIKQTVSRVADYMGDAFIVNVGVGIDYGRKNPYLNAIGANMCAEWSEDDQSVPDLHHLNPGIPCYLASLLYASTITGLSPFEVSWFPRTAEGFTYSSNSAYLAKVCATRAMNWLYGVTEGGSSGDDSDLTERVDAIEQNIRTMGEDIDNKVPLTGGEMQGLLSTVSNQADGMKSVPVVSEKTEGYKVARVGCGKITNPSGNKLNIPDVYINGQIGTILGDYINLHIDVPTNDPRLVNPQGNSTAPALEVVDSIAVKQASYAPFITDASQLSSGTDSYVNVRKTLVNGNHLATNDYASLNTGIAIAMLIKAVQELLARVETLEGGENP